MTKNKNKLTKTERRTKEILKAQARSSSRILDEELISAIKTADIGIDKNVRSTQRLDMVVIRRDLLKTFIFLIVVLVFLFYIRLTGLSFSF